MPSTNMLFCTCAIFNFTRGPKFTFPSLLRNRSAVRSDPEAFVHSTVKIIRRGRDSSIDGRRNLSYMLRSQWVNPFRDVSEWVKSRRNLNPSPWVKRVLDILRNTPSDSVYISLDELCSRHSLVLSPHFVQHILKLPDISKSPAIALKFFNWAGTQKGYRHTMLCYAYVIDYLAATNDLQNMRAVAVSLQLNLKQLYFTANACNLLVKVFGRTGLLDEALDMWRFMKERGIDPGISTFNCLISALINADRIEEAKKVIETMKTQEKVLPNVVTYNIIIKGFCKAGRTDSAMEYFREMETRSLPNEITYVTLMQAFYSKNRHDKTLSLFQAMLDKKLKIIPYAYGLVISGLCSEGKGMEANKLLQDMIKNGCSPNLPIYTSLIDGFFKTGSKDHALQLLKEVKQNGYQIDKVTCSTVINGLCKVGDVDMAQQYLKEFRGLGLDVNSFSYCSVIDGLVKAGKIKEAEEIFEGMSKWGCSPDTHCFNAMINGLCKASKVDKAMKVIRNMKKEGYQPTVYTYTILIDGLFKGQKSEMALKLWDEMIEKGIAPTAASFRILYNGLGLSGNVTKASRILGKMATTSVLPERAYHDIINVLVKGGRIKQACELADGLIDRALVVPSRVRSSFLSALRNAGNAKLALKLMHGKIGRGYTKRGGVKENDTFRTLLESDTCTENSV